MRPARPVEIKEIKDLFDEATKYANIVGHIDWPSPFPISTVQELIDSHELYLWGNPKIQAAAKASTCPPEKIWDSLDDDKYIFIGKLAVSSENRGRGFMKDVVLADVISLAIHEGMEGIRLDCLADNQRLQQMYQKLGFYSRGSISFFSYRQKRWLGVERMQLDIM